MNNQSNPNKSLALNVILISTIDGSGLVIVILISNINGSGLVIVIHISNINGNGAEWSIDVHPWLSIISRRQWLI